MESLQIYKQLIEGQRHCEDPWFVEMIGRLRSGDEMAGREISASCLRLALEIAEQRVPQFRPLTVLDLAQEGNVGLMDAIKSFQGNNAQEFIEHARQAIQDRLKEVATTI